MLVFLPFSGRKGNVRTVQEESLCLGGPGCQRPTAADGRARAASSALAEFAMQSAEPTAQRPMRSNQERGGGRRPAPWYVPGAVTGWRVPSAAIIAGAVVGLALALAGCGGGSTQASNEPGGN